MRSEAGLSTQNSQPIAFEGDLERSSPTSPGPRFFPSGLTTLALKKHLLASHSAKPQTDALDVLHQDTCRSRRHGAPNASIKYGDDGAAVRETDMSEDSSEGH